MVKAVVLLSGGLDSATALALAKSEGRECYPLCVVYGQRHDCEVDAAQRVAGSMDLDVHVVSVPALGELARSALTSRTMDVPKNRAPKEIGAGVPATYVPARNTVLLGLALACAESIGAREIWTGFNVLDASGYPDCRPEFVRAFEDLAQVATAPGPRWAIRAPLIALSKAKIIDLGVGLGVDYSLTHSCYDPVHRVPAAANTKWLKILAAVSKRPEALACGQCDACHLRRKGFAEADIADPTRYA